MLTPITIEDEKEIVRLYSQGVGIVKISTQFRIGQRRARKILALHGVKQRTLSQCVRRLSIDEFVFDEITEESAYWIGFIFADGHISKKRDGSPQISICLTIKDIDHLRKFKKFVKSEHKISIKKQEKSFSENEICKIQMSSERMGNMLYDMGVTARRKQNHCIAPDHLCFNRHFWRGYVDGDGWMGISQSMTKSNSNIRHPYIFGMCSSNEMLEQFRGFCLQNDVKIKNKTRHQDNVFYLETRCKQALDVVCLLYQESSIYLDRKFIKAQEMIAHSRNTY